MKQSPFFRGRRAFLNDDAAHLGRHRGFGPPFGHGFGPPFGPGFGPMGPGFGPGGPRGRGRGGRARGDVRTAILALLAEQPRHGYDLIRAIEERSGGVWTPSAGSVYPTLQALEDEGLLTMAEVDGKRTASLTDAGNTWVAAHRDEIEVLFTQPEVDESAKALRREMGAVMEAAVHVTRGADNPAVTAKAAEILATARKELYRLLADDVD